MMVIVMRENVVMLFCDGRRKGKKERDLMWWRRNQNVLLHTNRERERRTPMSFSSVIFLDRFLFSYFFCCISCIGFSFWISYCIIIIIILYQCVCVKVEFLFVLLLFDHWPVVVACFATKLLFFYSNLGRWFDFLHFFVFFFLCVFSFEVFFLFYDRMMM